jgi:hypothetical protein
MVPSRVDAQRDFNPTGAFNSLDQAPSCSGIYNKNSGLYEDYLRFNGQYYGLVFEYIKELNLFQLKDYELL